MPNKPYNFDLKLKTPKGHEIGIDTAAAYGYFTRWDGSEGGGLWFDIDTAAPDGSSRLRLVDYDGVSELPPQVYNELCANPLLLIDADFGPDLPTS